MVASCPLSLLYDDDDDDGDDDNCKHDDDADDNEDQDNDNNDNQDDDSEDQDNDVKKLFHRRRQDLPVQPGNTEPTPEALRHHCQHDSFYFFVLKENI